MTINVYASTLVGQLPTSDLDEVRLQESRTNNASGLHMLSQFSDMGVFV